MFRVLSQADQQLILEAAAKQQSTSIMAKCIDATKGPANPSAPFVVEGETYEVVGVETKSHKSPMYVVRDRVTKEIVQPYKGKPLIRASRFEVYPTNNN